MRLLHPDPAADCWAYVELPIDGARRRLNIPPKV
jgi:hypothetical protein